MRKNQKRKTFGSVLIDGRREKWIYYESDMRFPLIINFIHAKNLIINYVEKTKTIFQCPSPYKQQRKKKHRKSSG